MLRPGFILLFLLLLVSPRHPARADDPAPTPSPAPPVLLEDARLPAGTVVEPLGGVGLIRLGAERPARRYRVTGPPRRQQVSCNYVGGTVEVKRALWDLAVFDDPDGAELARLVPLLMDLRDLRRAGSPNLHRPEGPPDVRPPLLLSAGPGRAAFVVAWGGGRFWEWTFRGFAEGGGAFGNGSLPEAVRYGDGDGQTATQRETFTAWEKEFRPLFVTAP